MLSLDRSTPNAPGDVRGALFISGIPSIQQIDFSSADFAGPPLPAPGGAKTSYAGAGHVNPGAHIVVNPLNAAGVSVVLADVASPVAAFATIRLFRFSLWFHNWT